MWYLYLRRDQHYLRSYRTHNLWLDTYAKKMRQPKISAWHVAVMRKLSKSVSGVSTQQALIFLTQPRTRHQSKSLLASKASNSLSNFSILIVSAYMALETKSNQF